MALDKIIKLDFFIKYLSQNRALTMQKVRKRAFTSAWPTEEETMNFMIGFSSDPPFSITNSVVTISRTSKAARQIIRQATIFLLSMKYYLSKYFVFYSVIFLLCQSSYCRHARSALFILDILI